MPITKLFLAILTLSLTLAPSLSIASEDSDSEFNRNDYADIYGGRRGGFDTAYCPDGFRIQYCEFDNNACDNTTQGNNYCSADSRSNRQCRFHGRCVRRVKKVQIEGGRRDGYDTAYCPSGYRIQACAFDSARCDSTVQGYDYCAADSHNHQPCHFTGVCVRDQ